MIEIKNNEQLAAEERLRQEQDRALQESLKQPSDVQKQQTLLGFLETRWQAALQAKRPIEEQMFKNLDQARNVYETKKLLAIREIGGSEVYPGVTDTKCRNGIAWLKDIMFQTGAPPYGIDPTPVPELPQPLLQQLQAKFIGDTLQEVTQRSAVQGAPLDMNAAIQEIQATLPELQDRIKKASRDLAKDKAEQMFRELDDKLVEGGWYDALDQAIWDLVILKGAFLKGPIRRNKMVLDFDDTTQQVTAVKEIVEEYERRSPFDIYPQPDSNDINDGYLFDRVVYRKIDLQELIGIDSGYQEDEIRTVLHEAGQGSLKEWTGIETDRAAREHKDGTSVYDTDSIDCLEYHGTAPGSLLSEAGITVPEDQADFDFNVTIWRIGKHVIKAMVNEDPLGRKPYSKVAFDQQNDSFWGRGMPELIVAPQDVCNASARALVNNVGMGSGPQVEINVDRLHGKEKSDMRLIPWKRWLTTNKYQQQGQAIMFWQPQMHAAEILQVYQTFSKIADEHSSVPSWAHGDPQVGGGGNTSSGLSMLISQGSRGIRMVVKNIDRYLIAPSVNFLYERMALDPKYKDMIGDVKLVAKGSSALIEKEQRAVRMLELLNATNNPNDLQITGFEGRGYMLGEVAKTHDIDPEKVMPNLGIAKNQPVAPPVQLGQEVGPPQMANRGSPPQVATTLNVAGQPSQGTDHQLVGGRGGPVEQPATAA